MSNIASDLLVNIDVPDLDRAVAFYTQAFGLTVTRSFGAGGVELSGLPVKIYLLQKAPGSPAYSNGGAAGQARHYRRHWTPVHLDIVVDDIEAALTRALMAGATVDGEGGDAAIRTAIWGRLATLADPFGHGLCLIQFLGGGYDEVSERVG